MTKKRSAGRVKAKVTRPNDPNDLGRVHARGSVLADGFIHTDDEIEFLKAVEAWQRKSARKFPALSDYLAILKALGYRKP